MTVRSRNARSWETITAPPGRSATKRSSRARPSKSRSLVGSSSSRTSKRESRIAASDARAAWPPDSAAVSRSSSAGIEPEVAQDRLRALLQVGAAEPEPRLERVRVAVGGAGHLARHRVRGGVHARVGLRHAGAPREVVLEPLAGRAVGLLRQVAGGPGGELHARRGRADRARRAAAAASTCPRRSARRRRARRPGATVTETPARIVAAPCALCRSRAMSVPATHWSVRPGIRARPRGSCHR